MPKRICSAEATELWSSGNTDIIHSTLPTLTAWQLALKSRAQKRKGGGGIIITQLCLRTRPGVPTRARTLQEQRKKGALASFVNVLGRLRFSSPKGTDDMLYWEGEMRKR